MELTHIHTITKTRPDGATFMKCAHNSSSSEHNSSFLSAKEVQLCHALLKPRCTLSVGRKERRDTAAMNALSFVISNRS